MMCAYDEKGFKPCELQAMDCEGCEYSEVEVSDLIRKSSLIYNLQHWREKLSQDYGENDEYVRCLDSVLDVYISDAPTVDAVEVVRCENCERWDAFTDGLDSAGYCYKWHNNVQSDGYCSYGERKED